MNYSLTVVCRGPQLKRVVVTSSVVAISDMTDNGVLDESHWNERSIAEVHEKGRASTQKYLASKSLAEKGELEDVLYLVIIATTNDVLFAAALEFVKKNGSSLTWDLVTTHPSYVFGPVLHEVSSPSALNFSAGMFYDVLFTNKKSLAELEGTRGSWVDVRDVAEGHVRALEVPAAGGQRFILSGGTFIWQDWCT